MVDFSVGSAEMRRRADVTPDIGEIGRAAALENVLATKQTINHEASTRCR